jgi:hypothetical protein
MPHSELEPYKSVAKFDDMDNNCPSQRAHPAAQNYRQTYSPHRQYALLTDNTYQISKNFHIFLYHIFPLKHYIYLPFSIWPILPF